MYILSGKVRSGCISATRYFGRSTPFFISTSTRPGYRTSVLPCCTRSNLRLISTSETKWTMLSRMRMPTDRLFFFSNTATFSSRTNDGRRALSRTERRLLERKQRNKAKKEARMPTESSSSKKSGETFRSLFRGGGFSSAILNSQRLEYLFRSLVPRLPLRHVSFTRPLWIALSYRLPLFLALSYLLTDENISPYMIQGSLGPSMLPTIQFVGDIWVVETGAWGRAWRRLFGGQDEGDFPVVSLLYEVGDLVIWEDPKTGKRSCKRIIGLEGDTIYRCGEYRNLYQYRSDFGILWPKNKDKPTNHSFGAYSRRDTDKGSNVFEHSDNQGGKLEQLRTLIVPNHCVWLEGDCPLFSMDSRQYGPINVSKIRGRLVFRLWPWERKDLTNDEENSYLSSCWISKNRPVPYPSIEAYIGKRFNFYRIPSSSTEILAKRNSES